MNAPVRVLVFQNRYLLGGQERQTVLHLATLDRSRWEPVLACLHAQGEHLADVEAMGLYPEVVGVGARMLRPNTVVQVARLARFVRERHIALVHAQDLFTNVLGVLAARLAGVPSIVTRVDLGHAIVGYRWPLLRLAQRAADRVLVNARAIRDLCVRQGVDPARIAVVRNGVDLVEFDAAARRPVADPQPDFSRPTAILVGNMHHPVKGQSDALRAMREVARDDPRAQLLLVGDGVLRAGLEREAAELGLGDRVRFLGHRLDVPALVARCACAVSASSAEGISHAILEAMAARLPVVGTAVGGTPELVADGSNGFLVPPGAPAHLARRMRALLGDPERARRMGEEGRRIVQREFGVDRMRAAYDALYADLAGRGAPGHLAQAG